MTMRAELRVKRWADLEAPRYLRHVLEALLEALGVDQDRRADVVLAVGEALANVVEHAYFGRERGIVEISGYCDDDGTFVVEVADEGQFIERAGSGGRGYGLRIVRSIARDVELQHANGTRIKMRFDLGNAAAVI